jgi:CHASE2 domain-containing sensor protein
MAADCHAAERLTSRLILSRDIVTSLPTCSGYQLSYEFAARLILGRYHVVALYDRDTAMTQRLRILLLSAFAALATLILLLPPVGPAIDLFALRALFSLRGPREFPKNVVLVRVDTRSAVQLGLPGEQLRFADYAAALEKINSAHPRLVVFDMLFSTLSRDANANARLEKALSDSPSVIGSGFQTYVDTDLAGDQHYSLIRENPAAEFARSAKAVVPMLVGFENRVASTISLGDESYFMPVALQPHLDVLRRFVDPQVAAPGTNDLINFYGGPYSVPDVPIYELLKEGEQVSPEFFADKVVFVGAVDLPNSNPSGHDDSFITSESASPMWGVEVQATIVANLLDGSWLRRLSPNAERRVTVLAVYFFALVALSCTFQRTVQIAACAIAAWLIAAYLSFIYGLFFLPGAAAACLVFPALLMLKGVSELIALRQITVGEVAR